MHVSRTCLLSLLLPLAAASAQSDPAVNAINSLGLDLYKSIEKDHPNLCLSPYSIQAALAMTYAGADGATHEEMAKILHFPDDPNALNAAFASLNSELEAVQSRSAEQAKLTKREGSEAEPVTLAVANRLFGEKTFEFRQAFLDVLKSSYKAPLDPMDFIHNAAGATQAINAWVEEQTAKKIRDLIPSNALNKETALVLVNALYLKAQWAEPFNEKATKPMPFHVGGKSPADVPAMQRKDQFGYAKKQGFSAVSLPYLGNDLQFLVLVPDAPNGLPAVEAALSAELLKECANLNHSLVHLYLPKFKLEPPTLPLGDALKGLGLKTAFDIPKGSADFDKMAPRKPDDYLYISEVFHKTFIDLDEKGTEAAAATAVVMMRATAAPVDPPKPVEVKVDRPFLFAIQHRESGACLFLGRVNDPR